MVEFRYLGFCLWGEKYRVGLTNGLAQGLQCFAPVCCGKERTEVKLFSILYHQLYKQTKKIKEYVHVGGMSLYTWLFPRFRKKIERSQLKVHNNTFWTVVCEMKNQSF